MLRFEWDVEKALSNLAKDDVSFQEATTVFEDDLHLIFEDPEHSVGETRFLGFGTSAVGTALAVCYTERGDTIRIICARRMTRRETNCYEQ